MLQGLFEETRTMKKLLAIAILAVAGLSHAKPDSSASAIKGEVIEVKDVDSYTYLRLKTRSGETWAAVMRTPVRKGAQVSIENPMVMNNFESKTLKKTFPSIIFGSLGSASSGQAAGDGVKAWTPIGAGKAAGSPPPKVAKAGGANARTVEEITGNAAKLKDKSVSVRGEVVKYNPGIMGRNWVHLRDGTGSEAAGSNDILVTTQGNTKVGSTVTAEGIVRTNKDFGAGYAYAVIIEDAALK
jgi:hypothetical protein